MAVIPNPVVSQLPFQNEIGRPRYDSVDQPADSGIEEVDDHAKEVMPTHQHLVYFNHLTRTLQCVDTT